MANSSPSNPARGTLRTFVTLPRVYAVTRIALGTWLFVIPMAFGAKWFEAPQDPLLTASILRSVGGRDAAIGVGLLLSGRPRPWLWLCAFCDVLDAGIVLSASSKFSGTQILTSESGALAYALVAIAIAVFGVRGQRQAPRS